MARNNRDEFSPKTVVQIAKRAGYLCSYPTCRAPTVGATSDGDGEINQKGIDHYNNVINYCLEQGIEPWLTLYHWDLPQKLEKRGGWTNRQMVDWFTNYATICAQHFGDRVKHWLVMNEPSAFVGAGYFLGIHAPGRIGLGNFLPAIHHAILAMVAGGKTTVDTNVSVLFLETLWAGVSVRNFQAFGLNAQCTIKNKFRFGYAFELPTNSLSGTAKGTHELMLSLDLEFGDRQFALRRYF